MTLEALSSLKALVKQLRLQLLESPEFRALEVVDRTILELSEILNSPTPPPHRIIPPMPADEQPSDSAATVAEAPSQLAEVSSAGPTNNQSRMAKAIAATIAANAASINAATSTALRHDPLLSEAS